MLPIGYLYPSCHVNWISVEERLPEKEGHYLVYVQTPYGDIIRRRMKVARFNKGANHKKLHFYTNQTYSYKDITHWMELPPPPHPIDEMIQEMNKEMVIKSWMPTRNDMQLD